MTPQVIETGSLYTLDEVQRRLGLSDAALRRLEVDGLPLIREGQAILILGGDLIAFLGGRRKVREVSRA